MKSKRSFYALLVALLLVAASRTAWAANATYSPTTKNIEKTQPVSDTDSFDVHITSPASFSPVGNPCNSDPFSVETEIQIAVTDKPLGVLDADALALVSADPDTLTFTAKNQEKTTSITVDASLGIVGTYVYTIKAKPTAAPPVCTSWGVGDGTVLTVVINEQSATDETPPSVTITSPTADESFTFCTGGTPVGVAFYAVDSDSAISAVSADVNGSNVVLTTTGLGTNHADASGSYTANSIGGYTLKASATSLGGTSDATQNFSVNFNIMWLPPLSLGKTSKGGSTVPVKFTARDCNGNFIHDESVKVVVLEVTSGGDVEALSGLFGEGASSVRIDDEAGQYIINFQTAAGAHNYRVDVYFNDFNNALFKQDTKTFSVR
jgi:hypothetical protein